MRNKTASHPPQWSSPHQPREMSADRPQQDCKDLLWPEEGQYKGSSYQLRAAGAPAPSCQGLLGWTGRLTLNSGPIRTGPGMGHWSAPLSRGRGRGVAEKETGQLLPNLQTTRSLSYCIPQCPSPCISQTASPRQLSPHSSSAGILPF